MFGTFVRAGALWAMMMLIGTVLAEVLDILLPPIKHGLGASHLLYTSLVEVRDQYVVIATLTVVVIIIVRSVVESKVGGV